MRLRRIAVDKPVVSTIVSPDLIAAPELRAPEAPWDRSVPNNNNQTRAGVPFVRLCRPLGSDPALPPVSDHADAPSAEQVLEDAGILIDVVTIACAMPHVTAPSSPTDVAFYSAHPDDECMYGGGTMCRLVDAGLDVDLIVLSHGEGGRLLVHDADGASVDRSRAREEVAAIRDREAQAAAEVAGVRLDYLFDHDVGIDFLYTTSIAETFQAWATVDRRGLAGILARLVDDVRRRQPRVVVTLDVRDDPGGSAHGHHRAFGALMLIAARLAADSRIGGRPTHVVEEVVTYAPVGVEPDVVVAVDPNQRRALLDAHHSQFTNEEKQGPLAARAAEGFVVARQLSKAPRASAFSSLFAEVDFGGADLLGGDA